MSSAASYEINLSARTTLTVTLSPLTLFLTGLLRYKRGNKILISINILLFSVNHKALVDEQKASLSGEDLRVFYLANESSLPVEIDRTISNVYTASTSVQFKRR